MTEKRNREGNQGEGNRGAARAYNESQQKFAKEGDVEKKAEEARRAVEGRDADELKRAEKEGKSHAKEEDPNVTRRKPGPH